MSRPAVWRTDVSGNRLIDQRPGCWECHEPYYTFAPRCPYCDAPNPSVLLADAIDRSVAKEATLSQSHAIKAV